MKTLTDRQQELLSFIEDHLLLHGFPPSIREMADHMGIRSTNGVNDHLKALQKKGAIIRSAGPKSRAITLTRAPLRATNKSSHWGGESATRRIPLVGRVAAGTPVLSEENIEDTFELSSPPLPDRHDLFALKVQGESMIGKGVFDGDIVFVQPQVTARNGQMVVALIEGEATVKTFLKKSADEIQLIPENPHMSPIVIRKSDHKTTRIVGVVCGVYRPI